MTGWLTRGQYVARECEAFTAYTALGSCSVTGVGGEATIAGRGTVELDSTCDGQKFVLELQNVLHVPGTRNSLISLGRWDAAGGQYIGGGGGITLITKDGKRVAWGEKVDNNLYKMKVSVRKPQSSSTLKSHHKPTHIRWKRTDP